MSKYEQLLLSIYQLEKNAIQNEKIFGWILPILHTDHTTKK